MSARKTSTEHARGPARLLIDPTFGAIFWGKLFSVIGVWTHSLVAAVVMHDATDSALMVGLVGVVQFGPQLLLTPTSGKWSDRGNPARQIWMGRLLSVVGSATIAVWLAATGVQHATIAVLCGSLLVGVGFVIGGPAMQSIVPSLIRDGELPTAMALNNIPMTAGRLLGPVIGAVLLTQLGAPAAFAVSGASHLVLVILLIVVRFPPPIGLKSGIDYRVRAAVVHVWRDRPLLLALAGVTAVGFCSDPSITLAPSVAAELGGGTRLIGELSTVFGAGAAIALILLAVARGKLAAPWASAIGLWLLGLGSALLAIASSPAVAVASYGLAGLGFGVAMTGLSTVVQERSPAELRGRIMALWLVGFVGSRPLAAAVLGGTADLVSVQMSFAISTAVIVVVSFWCRPKRLADPRDKGAVRTARNSTR